MVYQILFEVEQGKKSAKEAQAALNKVKKEADGIEGSVRKLRKAFLQSFAVEELTRKVIRFTTEAINLARQADGVEKAFRKLNDPNILNQLRTATRGTVSDLELMKAAVRAQNFKIPLQQLGTFFDFARQRARDTGQSVDYLVNSIIDGIGRKSTLVLDNLGLSASEIQQEFAKTGDLAVAVGNIIQREMGDSADSTTSAADSIDRYNAAIENLKKNLGATLLPVLGSAAEALNLFITRPVDALGAVLKSGLNPAALAQYVAALKDLSEELEKSGEGFENFAERMTDALLTVEKNTTPFEELNKKIILFGATLKDVFSGKQTANISDLNKQLTDLKKELSETDLPISKLRQLQQQIQILENALKSLTGQGKEVPKPDVALKNPLEQLNDFLDESQAKADKLKADMEKLANLKFDVPEEEKPANEEEALKAINKQLEVQKFVREELTGIIAEQAGAVAGLLKAVGAGAEAQLAFSIVSTLASQGEAIGKGIASASALPYPANLGAIASVVATIIGTFAQVFTIINQANAAKAQAQAASAKLNEFAEGEIDIHRPGETRGKDSIPAVIMPGESVITTDKTSKYKPFLKAIHEGTLEDLIRVNYVEPALAVTAMEQAGKDSMIDYSPQWYRQHRTMLDGHSLNKQAIGELRQINKKLSRKNGGWYV